MVQVGFALDRPSTPSRQEAPMTRLLGLTLIVLLAACGDDEGPEDPQYQGQWTGTYTNSSQPDVVFQAVLQLTQNDRSITGTLTTTTATPNASAAHAGANANPPPPPPHNLGLAPAGAGEG